MKLLRAGVVWMVPAMLLMPLCASAAASRSVSLLKRGRYLVVIAGCNDCHTAGYAQSGGKVAERNWLEGSRLGWHGPWGTTYPPNLRLFMQGKTRSQWIKFARAAALLPPMPNESIHAMTNRDLSAIYAFIRHLGPAGKPAPAYLPPSKKPTGAFVSWPASPAPGGSGHSAAPQ